MPAAYLPNPEQIRKSCERIRDGWSPSVERRRRVFRDDVWEAPELESPACLREWLRWEVSDDVD